MSATKIIITGAAGFVGSHLTRMLQKRYPAAGCVVPTSKTLFTWQDGTVFEALDITNRQMTEDFIKEKQPTHIIHLAGVPSVSGVQEIVDEAWNTNVTATIKIAFAILKHSPNCVLIYAGSGEVYGASAKFDAPLDENSLLSPVNEYGATKAAADLALGALVQRGLRTIRFRPFNHIGPGQSEQFVVPAFATQIARIEAGLQEPLMLVGNLDAERDFLDVRDVANAYILATQMSDQIPNGTIMNLASGVPRRVGDILQYLLSLSQHDITIQPDPARQRPTEIHRIFGNARRARDLLGWAPQHEIESVLSEVLASCRQTASNVTV